MNTDIERLPKAPEGYACCNTGSDGSMTLFGPATPRQISHLVTVVDGGYRGNTLCGLTRFDERDPITWKIIRPADIPGWSMNGGVWGRGVVQEKCEKCWEGFDE